SRCPAGAAIDGRPRGRAESVPRALTAVRRSSRSRTQGAWCALHTSDRGRRYAPAVAPLSVSGHLRYEVGYLFGFLADVQQRRHLAEAAGAAFLDRAQHERLAAGRRRDVLADPHVEVRADPSDRLDRRERVTDGTGAREQSPPFFLVLVQVQPAHGDV